jgi:hypothetical protein
MSILLVDKLAEIGDILREQHDYKHYHGLMRGNIGRALFFCITQDTWIIKLFMIML